MAMELSRIMSHLVWLGTTCIDIGAFTLFLWSFEQREEIYQLFEMWIGARLTTSLTRVGGMGAGIPENRLQKLTGLVKDLPKHAAVHDRDVTRQGIWLGRRILTG